MKAESRKQKAEIEQGEEEVGGQGVEGSEIKVESGKLKAEIDWEKAEVRGQRSEGRGQAAEVEWTEEQERALAEFIERSLVRRKWMGSEGSGQWAEDSGGKAESRKQKVEIDWDKAEDRGQWEEGMPSSPAPRGEVGPKGFWFNVNAELVIYGATEANAQVTIGGRPIRLRPDGSFSLRFALPDGSYVLPVRAESADGKEGRGVVLEFRRETGGEEHGL